MVAYYEDKDKDGFGNPVTSVNSRKPVDGKVTNGNDCDDNDKNKNILICGKCGGEQPYFYKDNDGDGFGNPNIRISECNKPDNSYVDNGNDCDDNDKAVSKYTCGICGGKKLMYYRDNDGDGYGNNIPIDAQESCDALITGYSTNNEDCDDNDKNKHAIVCGKCGGAVNTLYEDKDKDGYGGELTAVGTCDESRDGYSANKLDCNDGDALIHPSQKEVCNQKDDNCDGKVDENLLVNGGWSEWNLWSSCSVACGGGIQERLRVCNNPAPFCGGEVCKGESKENMPCNLFACTSLSLSSSKPVILLGESVEINWAATGAFRCVASGSWEGKLEFNGKRMIMPESVGEKSYNVNCFNIPGEVIAAQQVKVMVEQPGDFDKDSCVDFEDFFLFAEHYDKGIGGNGWDGRYDLVANNRIDLDDFFKFAEYYGKGNCNSAAKPVALTEQQLNACRNPSNEVCNSFDDDCNGRVDDNCVNPGSAVPPVAPPASLPNDNSAASKNSDAPNIQNPSPASGEINDDTESSPEYIKEPSQNLVLKADFDGGGCVGFEDFFLLADAYGKRDERFDLNKNNVVDYPDFQIFERELGKGSC